MVARSFLAGLATWEISLQRFLKLAGSNIGIAMAFGLAALLPVALGIPRIRKQERNLAELDQRRQELKEFLDATA
jgi:hypothetical protein